MPDRRDPAALDKLTARIQGLRAKTTDNGCTAAEALLAAAKVAELLDRYDLSLTDVGLRLLPTRLANEDDRRLDSYRNNVKIARRHLVELLRERQLALLQ